MEFIATGFPGLFVIKPKVFRDERGFFMETYNRQVFEKEGLVYDFLQDNHAYSAHAGVLRGLHFQLPPMAQAKLVRVTRGRVFDAVVDLRGGSPTYGKWYGLELSAENFLQLLVPRGFAHGYATLERDTEFLYKVDNLYSAELDGGLMWNDPDLGVEWPVREPALSGKDRKQPLFKDFVSPFEYEE